MSRSMPYRPRHLLRFGLSAKSRLIRIGSFSSNDPGGRTPWLPNWVTKSFIRYHRSLNLAHFRLHDLRHFMATQMLNDGVPIAVVASRLAHARASTTLNV